MIYRIPYMFGFFHVLFMLLNDNQSTQLYCLLDCLFDFQVCRRWQQMQKSFRNIDSGNKGVVNFEQLRGGLDLLFCFACLPACLCLFVFVFFFFTAVIVACCGFKQ